MHHLSNEKIWEYIYKVIAKEELDAHNITLDAYNVTADNFSLTSNTQI